MTILRTTATDWFEILAPKIDCSKTLGNLGRTGAVEIEVRPHEGELLNIEDLAAGLDQFRLLSKHYKRYWLGKLLRHAPSSNPPKVVLERALAGIEAWRAAADSVIANLQSMEEEYSSLGYCQRFLTGIKDTDIDLDLLASSGAVISVVNAILPLDTDFQSDLTRLFINVEHGDDLCFLGIVKSRDVESLHREIKAAHGRIVERPTWIEGNAAEALARVINRRRWLEQQVAEHYVKLDNLYVEQGMADVLGDVICLEWFLEQVGTLEPVGMSLVWITGWVSHERRQELNQVLVDAGVPAIVSFPEPPAGSRPPQLFHNPWWSKPFELFARAFGTPAGDEVDPSPLLAMIVPLLFGYMFADVGQGLVLFLAGYWLQHRWESARILIAAGLSAMIFGFLFGSIFSNENLLPALVLHPLDDPLLTLLIPVLFGALLLIIAQLLNAIDSMWSGQFDAWLKKDAGLLVIYVGVLAGLLKSELFIIALVGVAWFGVGHILASPHWYSAFTAIAILLEDGVRLLVNTVSFARVGAFALAHAGLSSALMALSESTDSALGSLLIMLIGNLLVILLEGLVVSIQITRLVLFEFFVRFFKGTGRIFKPLAPPPDVLNVPPTNIH
jgi:V/A-type H+-transporting ATPase subunit I